MPQGRGSPKRAKRLPRPKSQSQSRLDYQQAAADLLNGPEDALMREAFRSIADADKAMDAGHLVLAELHLQRVEILCREIGTRL